MSEDVVYRVVCADPPWSFGDKLPGASRGAAKNYPVMSLEDICNMRSQTVIPNGAPNPWGLRLCGQRVTIADDAILFLWRVSSQVEEAYRVVRAWGFVPKTEIVWQKLTENGKPWFGMGRYVRASHETCIVATRGKAIPLIQNRAIRSTFEAKAGRHSQKPESFYELVEALTKGPYVELFARRRREGWLCLGNELIADPGDLDKPPRLLGITEIEREFEKAMRDGSDE